MTRTFSTLVPFSLSLLLASQADTRTGEGVAGGLVSGLPSPCLAGTMSWQWWPSVCGARF